MCRREMSVGSSDRSTPPYMISSGSSSSSTELITPSTRFPIQLGPPGLSAIVVLTADQDVKFVYSSPSIADIMGYESLELQGRSMKHFWHPEDREPLTNILARSLSEYHAACVVQARLARRDGGFVNCWLSYSIVYKHILATVTLGGEGKHVIHRSLSRKEVVELWPSPRSRKWDFHVWQRNSPSSSPHLISVHSLSPSHMAELLPDPPGSPTAPPARTFFILDRFTDTGRMTYVSNDLIVCSSRLRNQPFFSIVRPSDRHRVRQQIEKTKEWSPVVQDQKRTGGYAYCRFDILKIPDLPPHNHVYPQGTDELERSMPGQEFIPVEGMFTASSDGLLCITSRVDGRPPSR